MDEARTTPQPDRPAEPRVSDLQLQFEQVSVALTHIRQTQDRLHDIETRLAEMTRDCAGILDRWAKNDERHATAVVELHSRLSEWNDLERKLLAESATRIHQFERSLQHEWSALRQKHEEPIQRLDAQATRITESCLTAIDGALKSFDRAEARLGALEQQMYREMESLSREVRETLAELRQSAPQLGPRRPWSLDNVVRLHNELRAEGEPAETAPVLIGSGAAAGAAAARVPAALAPLGDPVEPRRDRDALAQPATGFPRESERTDAASESTPPSRHRLVLVAAALALCGAAGYGLYWRSQVNARLHEAAVQAEASARLAEQTRDLARERIDEIEKAAAARISSAQETAAAAQAMTMILAAPDLRRFELAGGPQGQRQGQVLWSRRHGVGITASRLQPTPADRVYTLWLFSPAAVSRVGTLAPDAAGRVSAAFEAPATMRTVTGAVVTLEPASGSAAPSGPRILTRPQAPAASQ